MNELLSNPKALILLGCLGAFIIGLNFSLVSLLRGNKAARQESSRWAKALRGGQEALKQQDAQLDELHRAVSRLKSGSRPADRRDE